MGYGVIFDWDGVIVDSSAAHKESWEKLAEEQALPLPPDFFARSFGRKNQTIIPEIFEWTHEPHEIERLSNRKEELYRELIRANPIDPLPGVRPLLAELRESGIPCAVGTSTPRANLDAVLDVLGLSDAFDAFVTAEDVSAGKPDPEVFLKAAKKIGRAPEDCVVFEDALFGIEAAHRAGMKVIAVATTHPEHELEDADLVASSLMSMHVDEITALFKKKK